MINTDVVKDVGSVRPQQKGRVLTWSKVRHKTIEIYNPPPRPNSIVLYLGVGIAPRDVQLLLGVGIAPRDVFLLHRRSIAPPWLARDIGTVQFFFKKVINCLQGKTETAVDPHPA